jgi:(2Fe-2S) ferredoxin
MTDAVVQYVLVCHGKNCLQRGAAELLGRLTTALDAHDRYRVIPAVCFGACAASPNVAAFPARLWYSRVTPENVPGVVAALLRGEEVPELAEEVDRDLVEIVFDLLERDFLKA